MKRHIGDHVKYKNIPCRIYRIHNPIGFTNNKTTYSIIVEGVNERDIHG